ncbi:hypothetical protein ACPOL_1702 [Acidisarcina polymorpha]|uniref:Uncharacterized protein n=1 Tax=Acidisarcina polymorpha TaxID=2211140 RepID=A0A2Z5FXC6_9BACT|nr:hypothetical protein [Acidisarcina polymorpha]AXC11046.1 hypothetical protein ACPOL_1702 [Acidisarcina polymorpha]
MVYICMCFGWYHELLRESRAHDLAAAAAQTLEMLDQDGMIVHVYRETDPDNPELVGRHRRLRSFIQALDLQAGDLQAGDQQKQPSGASLCHEVERFLLDPESVVLWNQAKEGNGLLEQRWSIVDFWSAETRSPGNFYGKAILIA